MHSMLLLQGKLNTLVPTQQIKAYMCASTLSHSTLVDLHAHCNTHPCCCEPSLVCRLMPALPVLKWPCAVLPRTARTRVRTRLHAHVRPHTHTQMRTDARICTHAPHIHNTHMCDVYYTDRHTRTHPQHTHARTQHMYKCQVQAAAERHGGRAVPQPC